MPRREINHSSGLAVIQQCDIRPQPFHTLGERWRALDITVEEGIKHLASLCITEIHIKGKTPYQQVQKPQPFIRRLLDTACVRLPEKLPSKGITVTTKTKLPAQRAA